MKSGYAPGSRDIEANDARFQEAEVEETFPRVARASIDRDCARRVEAVGMLHGMEAESVSDQEDRVSGEMALAADVVKLPGTEAQILTEAATGNSAA